MEIKHRSYARAVAKERSEGEDAALEDQQSVEMQVVTFFHNKNINLDPNKISACHTIPRKDQRNKPAIIIRFANRKHKNELLMQGRKLKGSNVYMNEHLTPKNAEIAREARILKKQNKIKATWTRNCNVLIRLNGSTPEEAKVIKVRELQDLDEYK